MATEREEIEAFFASRGLAYTAWEGYEHHQIFTAASDAGSRNCVMARIKTKDDTPYFCWGYYGDSDAKVVARTIKRVRKYWVMDVTIFRSAERI